jgi:NADPH:quinone reductase-like Zn-dependent oxidoreductase
MISHLAGKYGIKVIHVVHNQMQANNLRTNGIQYIADSSAETFEDDLKLLASQHQASLALDAVGGQMTRQLIMAMPYGGSVIIYGNLSGENPVTDHRTLIDDNKCISGFYLVNWLNEQNIFTTLRCISTARKMLKKGIQIPVQSHFDFNEMQTGIETYLGNMTSGKVLLIPGKVLPK